MFLWFLLNSHGVEAWKNVKELLGSTDLQDGSSAEEAEISPEKLDVAIKHYLRNIQHVNASHFAESLDYAIALEKETLKRRSLRNGELKRKEGCGVILTFTAQLRQDLLHETAQAVGKFIFKWESKFSSDITFAHMTSEENCKSAGIRNKYNATEKHFHLKTLH